MGPNPIEDHPEGDEDGDGQNDLFVIPLFFFRLRPCRFGARLIFVRVLRIGFDDLIRGQVREDDRELRIVYFGIVGPGFEVDEPGDHFDDFVKGIGSLSLYEAAKWFESVEVTIADGFQAGVLVAALAKEGDEKGVVLSAVFAAVPFFTGCFEPGRGGLPDLEDEDVRHEFLTIVFEDGIFVVVR